MNLIRFVSLKHFLYRSRDFLNLRQHWVLLSEYYEVQSARHFFTFLYFSTGIKKEPKKSWTPRTIMIGGKVSTIGFKHDKKV